MGKQWKQWETLFSWAPKSLQMVTAAMKLKDGCSLEEKLWPIYKQHIKKQRRNFANKGQSSQSYGRSSSHVWMWELDHKESWVPKNWCFWTVVLEKTLASPSDCKEIQPAHPKRNQPWIFIGRMLKLKLQYFGHQWRTEWKRPWCWERFKAAGEVNRGWNGWMTSPTQGTWVWVNSGSWWWTGKPGALQSRGS